MKGRRLTAFAHGEGGFGVQRTLHFAVEDGPARLRCRMEGALDTEASLTIRRREEERG